MGTYREHRYPKEMGISNSETKPKQLDRFYKILDQMSSMSDHKVVMIGDINCDMYEENKAIGRYDIKEMIMKYQEFMEDKKFALMNSKPTRHWPGVPSTLIDHIVTNQPLNIDNIVTKPTHISDHKSVFFNYHIQRLKEQPRRIKVRDYSLLTRKKLMDRII